MSTSVLVRPFGIRGIADLEDDLDPRPVGATYDATRQVAIIDNPYGLLMTVDTVDHIEQKSYEDE
jgi:hypothetical protein